MQTIILTIVISFVLAFLLGMLLGIFKKIFAVPVNEKAEAIRKCLSGGNCGGCGYPGCAGYAEAVANGEAEPNKCTAGGPSVAEAIGKILGVEVSAVRKIGILACRGTKECAPDRGVYSGVKTCAAAMQAINGTKMCAFGCIGFGDCTAACKFDALRIGDDGLPVFDKEKCTGCGACAKACPRHLIQIIPAELKGPVALCQNRSENKPAIMKNCKNGCIKCGKCERSCEAGALHLVKGIPEIDYDKCNRCGKCAEGCPTKVIAMM